MSEYDLLPQGANKHRYHVGIRDLILVRLDPGTTEKQTGVIIEDDRKAKKKMKGAPIFAKSGVASALERLLKYDPRGAAFAANTDLSTAIKRIQLEDEMSRWIDFIPLKSDRCANGFRSADELTLAVSWADLPFDPRIIRAMLVLHFEGTISPSSFARGSLGGERDGLLPATRSNLRFLGVCDDVSSSHGEADILTLKMRDLTAPCIDTQVPASYKTRLTKGATVVTVIAELLSMLAGTAGELIRGPFLRPADMKLPALDPSQYTKKSTTARDRNLAARNALDGDEVAGKAPSANRENPKCEGTNFWDLITDIAVSHGLIPYIELDCLILQEPKTMFVGIPQVLGQTNTPTFPAPGSHREQIGDAKNRVRTMVYGRDVSELGISRKLGRFKAPAVRVSAKNDNLPAKDRMIRVLWPTNPMSTSVTASGKGKTVDVHNVLVHGIVDKNLLTRIARAVYEFMSHGEVGLSITTSDLASWSDHPRFDPNKEPDLLDLRAGDPMRIVIAAPEIGRFYSITDLTRMIALSSNGSSLPGQEHKDAVSYLHKKGFAIADAQQLVKVLRSAMIPEEMRVSSIMTTIDPQSMSVMICIELRDYIRVRGDPVDVSKERSKKKRRAEQFGPPLQVTPGPKMDGSNIFVPRRVGPPNYDDPFDDVNLSKIKPP